MKLPPLIIRPNGALVKPNPKKDRQARRRYGKMPYHHGRRFRMLGCSKKAAITLRADKYGLFGIKPKAPQQ